MRAWLAMLAALSATLVVACGGKGSDPLSRSDSPEWRTLASAPLARTEVAAARVGRFIYVMGGFERDSGATTAATERYDIERDRWTRVADMPVALNHAAAAPYRGFVYVLGGYRGRTRLADEVATLFRYDPGRDRWTRLPSAPTRRGALTLGVIGDRLYAAGGASSAHGALPTLEIYDFRRRRWRRGPDMAVPREHLAGAVAGGRFYVLAGRAAGQGNFTVVEAYDPRTRRWRRLPDMAKARGGIAAATVGGRIVVVGGEETAGTIREVERFDPRRRRWSRLPDMPTPRHGLGAVARDGRVYVIEGGDRPGFAFTNALEVLDLREEPVSSGMPPNASSLQSGSW
jgi:N-acetylneuraminic acid mutarotase